MRSSWSVTSGRLDLLRTATVYDAQLQQEIGCVLNARPLVVSTSLHIPASPGRTVDDKWLAGIQSNIVVPESQREYILQKLHESHQGLTKCRQNAQNAVRWPGLSRDLTELTDSCRACREPRPSQKKQPTILQERPWRKLGADLCACQGKDYLVVADYYSRWLEVLQPR